MMSNGYLLDSGLNRDSLASAIADIAALQDKTLLYVVAQGFGQTDGVGGFNSNFATNCTVSISGTLLLVTFDVPRPTSRYAISAIRGAATNNYPVSTSQSNTSFTLQMRVDSGGTASFATSILTYSFAVMHRD
jgi:hypothetical protein